MQVNRKELLRTLKVNQIAVTRHEILDQSNCLVFGAGTISSFDGEILVRTKSPLDLENAVVPADDLIKLLAKYPDEEIDIRKKGSEVLVQGKRRRAGISCVSEVSLPLGEIPIPKKWRKIREGVPDALQQAAKTCGRNSASPVTTMVHVTKDLVEACDNYRLYRYSGQTGFPREVSVPGESIAKLDGLGVLKTAVSNEGWIHWLIEEGHEIVCRCYALKYPTHIEKILKLSTASDVRLPPNLSKILGRATIMTGDNPLVRVEIKKGLISVIGRKESGWYREQKRIRYDGPTLAFDVHPLFLDEILKRSRKVQIGNRKMKIATDNVEFVVCLEVD